MELSIEQFQIFSLFVEFVIMAGWNWMFITSHLQTCDIIFLVLSKI